MNKNLREVEFNQNVAKLRAANKQELLVNVILRLGNWSLEDLACMLDLKPGDLQELASRPLSEAQEATLLGYYLILVSK